MVNNMANPVLGWVGFGEEKGFLKNDLEQRQGGRSKQVAREECTSEPMFTAKHSNDLYDGKSTTL